MLNFAVLWWPIWEWRPVEIFRCQESIRDIIIYPHVKWRWNRTMLNLWCIVVAILKMATGRIFQCRESFGTSLSTHKSNFDDIGQCWIFAVLWWPFWKWRPVEIFNGGNQFETSLSTHISNFDDFDNVEFLRTCFMPCFGSHFENGRHLENFENAELLL